MATLEEFIKIVENAAEAHSNTSCADTSDLRLSQRDKDVIRIVLDVVDNELQSLGVIPTPDFISNIEAGIALRLKEG